MSEPVNRVTNKDGTVAYCSHDGAPCNRPYHEPREEDRCDHPNGFGVNGCPCGATGPDNHDLPQVGLRSLTPGERAVALDPDAWSSAPPPSPEGEQAMLMTRRIRVTMYHDYTPNPHSYPDGATIDDMMKIDLESAEELMEFALADGEVTVTIADISQGEETLDD